MNRLIGINCLVFFLVSCRNKNNINIYDPDNFVRITSVSDSVKEMRVIYLSKIDINRNLIRTYYKDGSLMGISYYYNRKRDGHCFFFSESKIAYEGNFSNGKKVGIHKTYFSNGLPYIIEEYKDGQLVSKTEYTEDGKVFYTEKNSVK